MTLDDEDIQAIVTAVLDAIHTPPADLVDAETLARHLGISKAAVWRNAQQLGGIKIGNGSRPRWRFDLKAATTPQPATTPDRTNRPRRRRARPQSQTPLLPVHE